MQRPLLSQPAWTLQALRLQGPHSRQEAQKLLGRLRTVASGRASGAGLVRQAGPVRFHICGDQEPGPDFIGVFLPRPQASSLFPKFGLL